MNAEEIIKIRIVTRATSHKPFADSIAFATAILESREHVGWIAFDRNGVSQQFIPAKDYAPYSIDVIWDRKPDELLLEYLDREYSYHSPHTLKKVYT